MIIDYLNLDPEGWICFRFLGITQYFLLLLWCFFLILFLISHPGLYFIQLVTTPSWLTSRHWLMTSMCCICELVVGCLNLFFVLFVTPIEDCCVAVLVHSSKGKLCSYFWLLRPCVCLQIVTGNNKLTCHEAHLLLFKSLNVCFLNLEIFI